MQFHIPSVVQAVPAAIADPEPVVPVLAGTGAEATGVEAAGAAGDAAGLEATTAGAEVGWAGADETGTVAKTPPDRAVLVATGADGAWVAAFVVAGAAAGAEDPPDPPPATTAPQLAPVGFARAEEVA